MIRSLILVTIVLTAALEVGPTAPRSLGEAAGAAQDVRYLLKFRALPPHDKRERNFYELARDITGFIDGRRFPPSGVITTEEIRYGVSSIKRARVVRTTSADESPRSESPGFYVLVHDAVYKVCARTYSVAPKGSRPRAISYVDCDDGRHYEFPVTTQRPLSILEVEVSSADIFREVWEARGSPH